MHVFLNPGHAPHGNPDPGAVNINTGLRESDVVAAVGNAVAQYLINAGVDAEVLQHDDLATVCAAANNSGADLFLSIHCNAADSSAALGTETYCYPGSKDGMTLANAVQRQIVDNIHTVDRGVKLAVPGINGLYVLNNTDMPAVLVELAFISNEHDEALLANYQDAFARAIARGVTDYQRTL
ncbi:N-acetylmuramoyl-L-alanine amidase [uncultured Megasphaera sp.]|uniref:N-acetylmuramoyl-L-alanine amidase family protein n=1 Tax=uncultured Megasphaera sp. TaxID=165188 RepID=UPI00266C0BEC|nr:N-acetylmuramoyl-L-alanine amidase [uncultured Megasphaera sp.]